MTKEECDRHMDASKGYNYTNAFFEGNDCVYSYKKQPLCEDIDCEDQTECSCMTIEDSKRYMTDSKGYTCNDELDKGNNCGCRYKEQPLCKDIDCEDQKEGRYMTKNNCKKYAQKYPGYPCNDEFCKDNNCVYSYKDQLLCEDIECEDQKECRCMTKEDSERYMTDSKGYTCNNELNKCNDCECSYKEQPLCEDVRCADQKEDAYMTNNNCK